MAQQNNGGSARPQGGISIARTKDMGVLRDVRVPLHWRIANAITRHRGTPALAAANVLGKVFGATTMRAALHGTVLRPNYATLAPDAAIRLKVALQAKVDLSAEQMAAVLADIANWPRDLRELARYFGGDLTQYGLLSTRLVTDLGVAYIVDAFQNLTELENMKFHGYGTGTTAEAQADTALVTELTTEYAVNSTRPTGTTTEGASANIYRTVATLSPDSGGTLAITEHGVFSASSAGTLLDRSKFSAINLVANADSLQTTYELTVSAGG
jgi:hypothetical protein